MIKRKFAALPLYIEYRCNACGKVFSVEVLPDVCPLCKAVLKESGCRPKQDEIDKRRV